ncbi:fatty-acyl-CoA synthase [Bradyrhizobium sp. USDA 4369]
MSVIALELETKDIVASHRRATPGRIALSDLEADRHWTWAELHAAVDRLAAWLVERLGPCSAQRVACLSRNRADVLLLYLASVRAGAIFVPLNWRLARPEVRALIEDATPEIIFHEADFDLSGAPGQSFAIERLQDLGREGSRPDATARRSDSDVSTLLYTSGTTGRPKGVMISERAAYASSLNMSGGCGLTGRCVFLCDMPLFHTAGLFLTARATLQSGGRLLLSGGFDPMRTFARLTDPELGVSHYFSVPEMAAAITRSSSFDGAALRRLECWAIGGAPVPPALISTYLDHGVHLVQGFGMTETGANLSMPPHDLARLREKIGSCGLPLTGTRMRLVPVSDGGGAAAEVDIEEGELWLAGPGLAQGYWNQPEATRTAFHDGWFATGDIARRDADGFFRIVDRKKDMFISGGENVYPAEVEAALCEYPAVAEVAVVGVPDERWGEVGCAYVVLRPGAQADADALAAHCADRLGKFKIPRSFVVTAALPRTASGKVQKRLLQAEAQPNSR